MSHAYPERLEVVPTGPLQGVVRAPGSKSVTNRLLLMATLASGTSRLRGPLDSDDSAAMRDLVTALGATIDHGPEAAAPTGDGHAAPFWDIIGVGGQPTAPAQPIDCRLSGTTIRFGTAVAALAPSPVTLTGDRPLRARPLGALTAALHTLGARIEGGPPSYPPVTIGGGLQGGAVTVDASGSSQFVSAVLLAAPYAATDVHITAEGSFPAAYVDLTAETMRRWGAVVERPDERSWLVRAGVTYQARTVDVEYDASAAAHLYGLAAATGGRVTIPGVTPSVQPDSQIGPVLERFGAMVEHAGDRVTVNAPATLRPGGQIHLAAMPDQVTTVSALAALAPGVTEITGVEVVRGHETDRLAALATELAKLGTTISERPDGLVIDGRTTTGGPATLDTYHDHRLAMAFAAVAARLPGVTINQPGCVAKTFHGFWDALVGLGGEVGPG